MAARSPRLRFASPFVITIAAALPVAMVASACVAESRPVSKNPPHPHANPPGPDEQTPPPPPNPASGPGEDHDHAHPPDGQQGGAHPNPPPRNPGNPGTGPATPPPTTPGTPPPVATGGGKPNPPRVIPPSTTVPPGGGPPVASNPPPPQVPQTVSFEQKWTVRRTGDTCTASRDATCPKPEKGKERVTCNPPPPVAYACPTGLLDTKTVMVVMPANTTECRIGPRDANACPPNAKCALPKPGVVPCPSR